MTGEEHMAQQNVTERPTPDTTPAQPARAAMRTVTVITGDRLCTHCGYNLTGQTIMREPEYGLLIVRCPECAQVASVTEYPLLGKWANRWAAMIAALYLFAVLALLAATVGPIVGMCFASGEIAGQGMSMFINDEVNTWTIQAMGTAAGGPPAPGAAPPVGPGTTFTAGGTVIINTPASTVSFNQWWAQQTRSGLIARAGGWRNAIDAGAFYMWFGIAPVGFVAGCMWAIIALSRGVIGRLIIATVLTIFIAGFCLIPVLEWSTADPWNSWSAGAYVVGPRMTMMSLLFAIVCLFAGMFAGRPLVRGMVRLFLPPRLRSSLAILWTASGKTPPRAA